MLMCDSGRTGAEGGRHAKNPLAQVVDGPVSIRALSRPRYHCSFRRSVPPSPDFPTPPGAGEKESP
jgi:hypothetical protein